MTVMSRASSRLRILFLVQGEGRGHLTQALAAGEMLARAGHELAGAVVGASPRRRLPAFFLDGLGAPVETVESPNFVAGADGRVRLGATALAALAGLRRYGASLDRLGDALDRVEPDVVVNFYEGLGGAYALLRDTDVPVVAVGHQFLFGHDAYPFAPGQPLQRAAVTRYTRLAGAGAAERLALSFYDAPPRDGFRVTPPLLRRSLFARAGRPTDGSLVVYLMEPAMAHALVGWSDRHPDVRLYCFSDVTPHAHSAALSFHALSGERFLDRMAVARGVVCSAGFESVSEAMWLGVPALMTPTPGHYEQRCNAADAEAAGAGIAARTLDLDRFLEWLDAHPAPGDGDAAPATVAFRAWVARAERQLVQAVEAAAGLPPAFPAEVGDGQSGAAPRLEAANLW
jgi:uncharacterized protein (TIGR00661 family)